MFTYHSANGPQKGRIDYFLTSSNLISAVKSVGKGIFYLSDHRSIYFTMDFANIKSGKKKMEIHAPYETGYGT